MQSISTSHAPAAIGPYSQAIHADPWLFISGQIPMRPDGTLVSGSIAVQTQQVLDNLRAILHAADADISDLVKVTIYLTNMADFPSVNDIYGAFLGDHHPARATVAVAALPKGAAIEIDAVAIKLKKE